MFAWLSQNIGTIIVGAVVVAIVGLIVWRMIANKRAGKSSCGCPNKHFPLGGNGEELFSFGQNMDKFFRERAAFFLPASYCFCNFSKII